MKLIEVVEGLDLTDDKIINFNKLNLAVKNGEIRILKSDCPKKVCEHTGWISSSAQTIVCVPNKILIEIVNMKQDVEYNAISY